jgi:hypothetical protein
MSAGGWLSPIASFESGDVVGFKSVERSIEHFPAWHDHNVEACADLVSSEDLACQPLRAISFHRRPEFPGGGDTQSQRRRAVRNHEQRHKARLDPDPGRIGAFEIGPAANPLGGHQSVPLPHRSALVGHRQALSTLGPAPLQYDSAVLGCHAHAEAVCLLPAAYIGLKCALSLHLVLGS